MECIESKAMNQTNKYILPKSLLALLTVALFAGGSLGSPILDQSQEDYSGRGAVFNGVSLAQTFKPSVSDYLLSVELYVSDKPWGTHQADAEHPLLYPYYSATTSIL